MPGSATERRSRRALIAVTLAACAALALPGLARAAVTTSVSGSTLTIDATNTNPFVTLSYITAGTDRFTVADAGGATAGAGCSQNGSGIAECDDDDITSVVLNSQGGAGAVMSGTVTGLVPATASITLNGGSGNDGFTAGAGNDTLHGNAGSHTFDGGLGNDTIDTGGTGNPGSQILTGGDGADIITGAGGNNIIVGGTDTVDEDDEGDTITGGPLIDTLDGSGGGDTINAGGDDDVDVRGGAGNDILNGDAGEDILDGGENLSGPEDDDFLNGGTDDDLLLNSEGADSFFGGNNDSAGDTVDYSVTSGSSAITADIGGAAGGDGRSGEGDSVATDVENLTGDGGADTLTGSSSANDIDGQGGNDTLRGGSGTGPDGADQFIGNTGTADLVSYDGRTDVIVADIDGAPDDGAGGCPGGAGCEDDDIETTVENLTGGTAGDTLTAHTTTTANELRGGPGTGADTLNGNAGADILFGGTGSNTALDGADSFNGGADVDEASYAGRTDTINADIDAASGDDGGGNCPSGAGCEDDDVGTDVENLTGGSAGDFLTGNANANLLSGGSGTGSDQLAGGTTAGFDGADVFDGGAGTDDTVSYANRFDEIVAEIGGPIDGIEQDDIQSDIENLVGSQVDDRLVGDADANSLVGLAGDDQLFGSRATGPDGADEFVGGAHGLAGGFNGEAGDIVNYVERTDGLHLTIGGGAASGAACPGGGCENDDIGDDMERITSGSGNDTIRGNSEANNLQGNAGNDTLQGGTGTGPDGADSLSGGSNTATGDTISYANRADPISAVLNTPVPGTDNDTTTTAENLIGGSGDDVLLGFVGSSGDNTINGGSGDDVLKGSLNALNDDGADTFIGGPNGSAGDTVTYSGRSGSIVSDVGGGADDADGDNVGTDVENLTGGSAGDTLTGSAGPNTLTGGNGVDNLTSLGGADRIEAIDTTFADIVDCGDDADSAGVDEGLDIVSNCEVLGDPPVIDPPADPPANPVTNPATGGAGQKKCKKGQKRKKVRGKVKCVKKGKKRR